MSGWAATGGKITERDAIKVAKRVEFWRDRMLPMGLAHWRIDQVSVVEDTPGSVTAKATVQPSHAYDSVIFWFKHDFVAGANQRELDETILHEWVHVFMRDLDQAVESVEGDLAAPAAALWNDRIYHEREGVVDRLARTIYVLYKAEKGASPLALSRIARSVE